MNDRDMNNCLNADEYQYKVSVVVPVYNAQEYIVDCVGSLIEQTIDQDYMEIILIDDGSTDACADVCRNFSEKFNNIQFIQQKNKGVSAARNNGILHANGKYIMFVDADDTLSAETVEAVVDFFDSHYNDVDMVSYPERKYVEGVQNPVHFRYKYLKETGIYDLNKDIYVTQSRINVAVKNSENPELFNENLKYAEDQEYLFNVLKKKMKLGFVDEGEYRYNIHSNSAVEGSGYAYNMFESVITDYYEKSFNSMDEVPEYLQALCLYDINWKIVKDQLFPYHYEEKEFKIAVSRIKNILSRISNKIILEHPVLDYYHRFYLLKLKGEDVTSVTNKSGDALYLNGKLIHKQVKQSIIVEKFLVHNGKLSFLGSAKSVTYDFSSKPEIFAIVNDTRHKLEIFESNTGRYKSKIKTNLFWGFYFDISVDELQTLKFEITINNIVYAVDYYFMPHTPFSYEQGKVDAKYISGDVLVEYRRNTFIFSDILEENISMIRQAKTKRVAKENKEFARVRELAEQKESEKQRIWLYFDCNTVEKDNGYYQFMHDWTKQDGVQRYYVSNRHLDESENIFEQEMLENVIAFGSDEHKTLLFNAEKIITAYAEKDNIYPYNGAEIPFFSDFFRFEVIYLQHGILHASIPWKYTPEALRIDKIVVSSSFEEENFQQNYNFRACDIIKSGMPRFSHMSREVKSRNRILFAPSWRNYLITPKKDDYWKPQTDKFMKSDYYIKFNQFLNSKELNDVLEEYDYYLDVKLHPIFREYKDCFLFESQRIMFYDGEFPEEEYAIFITDFSSYVFDFAYRKKPIFYFVPDYPQFLSGMNQYRNLDLPFEKAFGRFSTEVNVLVENIKELLINKCSLEPVYKERMEQFFLPFGQCEEEIYNNIIRV